MNHHQNDLLHLEELVQPYSRKVSYFTLFLDVSCVSFWNVSELFEAISNPGKTNTV